MIRSVFLSSKPSGLLQRSSIKDTRADGLVDCQVFSGRKYGVVVCYKSVMAQLIQALPEGPVDIVGDIHGEAERFIVVGATRL